MLPEERQNEIVAQVNRDGSVLVKELSEKFGVTEDSIRKDLTILEKKGKLKKTYGGAIKVRVNMHDFYAARRRTKYISEKKKIAEKAYELIEEGDMIFLDISTANVELAKLIIQSQRNVTIVTNMIDIMLLFTIPMNVKLIFIGGIMSEGKDGFVGALTNREIEKYRFDKAYLGVVGVDLEKDSVTTYNVDDAITKSCIMEYSNKSYMMLETRKLETDGNYKYARVSDFTGGIIEKVPNSTIAEKMESKDIQWI